MLVIAPINVCVHHLRFFKCAHIRRIVCARAYSNLAVVFSGCQGFHVHVMDFDYHDWVSYREKDPIWCHHASRFKFTKLLQRQTHVFDRAHVNVSVDPMRIVTVPNTVNGKTGLVCCFIGGMKDLERLTIPELLDKSKDFAKFHSYPEPLESPLSEESPNGVMKQCDQNWAEAA